MINPMECTDTIKAYHLGYNANEWQNFHIMEIADAILAWKKASKDHGDTSYWGMHNIRKMRAYWLGMARRKRHEVNLRLVK